MIFCGKILVAGRHSWILSRLQICILSWISWGGGFCCNFTPQLIIMCWSYFRVKKLIITRFYLPVLLCVLISLSVKHLMCFSPSSDTPFFFFFILLQVSMHSACSPPPSSPMPARWWQETRHLTFCLPADQTTRHWAASPPCSISRSAVPARGTRWSSCPLVNPSRPRTRRSASTPQCTQW